jgi:hypothetical protein
MNQQQSTTTISKFVAAEFNSVRVFPRASGGGSRHTELAPLLQITTERALQKPFFCYRKSITMG